MTSYAVPAFRLSHRSSASFRSCSERSKLSAMHSRSSTCCGSLSFKRRATSPPLLMYVLIRTMPINFVNCSFEVCQYNGHDGRSERGKACQIPTLSTKTQLPLTYRPLTNENYKGSHNVGIAVKESCDNSLEWLAISTFPNIIPID